jgi:phosphoglycerate dehydrogenase-like enzyme
MRSSESVTNDIASPAAAETGRSRGPNILVYIIHGEHRPERYLQLIPRDFPGATVRLVRDPAEARAAIGEAEVLLTYGVHLDDDLVARASRLRWIHSLISGTDWLPRLTRLAPEVHATSTRGIHGRPVGEMAILLMMALARGLPRYSRNQQAARWERFPGGLVYGKTVGILGVGVIAEGLAPMATALGMTVIGISGAPARAVPGIDRLVSRDDLTEIAPELDFLVTLIPLTTESRGIVDAAVFAAMKPTAYLVHLARGPVVDEAALLAALREGRIAGAALDVFAEEPLPPSHPFWRMENVVVTPHNAGLSERYVDDAYQVFAGNLRAYLDGRPDRMVNLIERAAPQL